MTQRKNKLLTKTLPVTMASIKPCTNSNFKWCVWDCRRASDFGQLLITFLISESDFVKASYADHLKNSDFKKNGPYPPLFSMKWLSYSLFLSWVSLQQLPMHNDWPQ